MPLYERKIILDNLTNSIFENTDFISTQIETTENIVEEPPKIFSIASFSQNLV